MLPGVLLRNAQQQFVCKNVLIQGEHTTPLKIPVAHGEGRYYASNEVLDELERNNQVIYRYVNEAGEQTTDANPNGASRNIAGIRTKQGNVFGMMPHPERACSEKLSNKDGVKVFAELGLVVPA